MTADVVSRLPVKTCEAEFCDKIAEGHRLCVAHRRALKLTRAIQDAILEFVMLPERIRPGTRNDKKIIEAGDHFAHGIHCLIGTLFTTEDVIFEGKPIVAQMGSLDSNVSRWRVQFKWIAHNGNLLADDSDADLDDDLEIGNDDDE